MRASTVSDLRQNNRAAVLRSIVSAVEATRSGIAAQCDLSSGSVTNIVTDLIAEGLVREFGSKPSSGGRPIARLSVVPEGAYFVGADVGELGVTVEVFDLTMTRVDRVFRKLRTRSSGPRRVKAAVADGVAALRKANPHIERALVGMGLGLPGIVDTGTDGVTRVYAQSLGWPMVTLDDLLAGTDLPTFADNGAKTLATAELWYGSAQGAEHSIVALLGRGIGVGVISGGRVLRGASSSAGEWGHTKVSFGGPTCSCGGRGCLEAYIGGVAVAQRWSAVGGRDGDDVEATVSELFARAADGDDTANRVVDETTEILGLGLANLVNLFNPERIVVGGWLGLPLIDMRRRELDVEIRRQALSRPAEQVALSSCRFGTDAVALGAALLPLEHFIAGTLELPESAA